MFFSKLGTLIHIPLSNSLLFHSQLSLLYFSIPLFLLTEYTNKFFFSIGILIFINNSSGQIVPDVLIFIWYSLFLFFSCLMCTLPCLKQLLPGARRNSHCFFPKTSSHWSFFT